MKLNLPLYILSVLAIATACNNDKGTALSHADAQEKVVKVSQGKTPPPLNEFRKDGVILDSVKGTTAEQNKEAKEKKEVIPVAKEAKVVQAKKVKPTATKKPVAPKKKANVQFENRLLTHNFGELIQGEETDYRFKFINTGSAPLEIINVTASCGCTQPSYPFIPIAPGETGFIGVHYNSKGKLGPQKPEIAVFTNIKEEPYLLFMEGYVNSPPKEETLDSTAVDSLKSDN